MAFDEAAVRAQFPITRRRIRCSDGRSRPLAYMDHGATTHPPQPVLDAVARFCSTSYGVVGRGATTLSQEASAAFEDACAAMARFVGADPETQPAVLSQSTTHALDLAAHLVAGRKGKTLVTLAEHHSNDLPHRARGPVLHAEIDGEGRILLDDVEDKLQRNKVKLLAVTGASNVTGHMPDLRRLARLAHDNGALFLLDAAQLLAHAPIDVKPEGHPEHVDLVAAAGHKAYAPFGCAFLAAPRALLDEAPPHVAGSGTVKWVTQDASLLASGPARHMAGSQNTVGAVAFAAALRFLGGIGMDEVRSHEAALVRLALRRFAELEEDCGVRLLGPTGQAAAARKSGVFAFTVPGCDHAEAARLLDSRFAIATRNGTFCSQPQLHRLLGLGRTPAWTKAVSRGQPAEVPGAVRATFGVYNTEEEVGRLAEAVRAVASGKLPKGGPRRRAIRRGPRPDSP